MAEREPISYVDTLRTSIRFNASAYGFSIMVTATFGVLTTLLGSPSVFDVYMWLLGAVGGFVVLEAIASGGFRHRGRGERSQTVLLGAALGFVSVSSGVGMAALAAVVIGADVAWAVGSMLASATYILILSAEMLLARRMEEEQDRDEP